MSNELQADYISGRILYVLIRNSIGQIWQTTTSTFVSYVTANFANYDIALTEQGTASGYYTGSMPSVVVGTYNIIIKERIGGGPVESDPTIGIGTIQWTGTTIGSIPVLIDGFTATGFLSLFDNNSGRVYTDAVAGSIVKEIRNAVTGGNYTLSTDSSGKIRIVDGMGVGELDTLNGSIVQVNQLGVQAKADVNGEIVNVLINNTSPEPGQGTPPATLSLYDRIRYMYKSWRNKIEQTGGELRILADDNTTVDHKTSVSDDGTIYTRSKLGSGP